MPTLAEIRAFVNGLSEAGALVAVQETAAARLIELDAAKRPVIFPGRLGRINTTISRPCLRRLTGTVGKANRTGSRFDLLLDEDSTEQLRRDPRNQHYTVPQDVKRYALEKIPAACIELTDTPAES
nr:hypothetical protein [Streptomyces chartreusis]